MKLPMILALAVCLASCVGGAAPVALPSSISTVAATPGPELNNYGQATIPTDGLIVFQGDDLAYGADPKGKSPAINGARLSRSATPPAEAMARVLGVRVENRGFPGDSIVQGAKRWAGKPAGALVIISYGYGDTVARTPVDVYEATLRTLIRSARGAGAAVFLVTTPGVGKPEMNRAVDAYRQATRRVGASEGAPVFEAFQAVIKDGRRTSPTIYQTPDAYARIAGAIIPYVQVAGGP